MKKLLFAVFAILGFIACGQKSPAPASKDKPTRQNEPGDSTHYGLACDGCTDSILILLPFEGGDPDTFDIIRAYQERQIYGRPRIGDELAVILNPEDKQEALKVINIERLKGQWCYQVTPTFRNIDKMPQKMQRRMMERIPDSVKERLMAPREYAIRLKRNHFAQSVGAGRNLQRPTDTRHRHHPTDSYCPEADSRIRYCRHCAFPTRHIGAPIQRPRADLLSQERLNKH